MRYGRGTLQLPAAGRGTRSARHCRLDGSGPPEVQALAEDSRRNLWVATPRALFRRRPNGEIDFLHIPIPIARINSMLVDGHDRLWVGGYGLVGIDTKTEPPRLLPPEDIPDKTPALINVLYPGERGEIWIGRSTGLVRFRPDASPPDVLVYTAFRCISYRASRGYRTRCPAQSLAGSWNAGGGPNRGRVV